jgi:hypothetical protein
MVVEFGVRWRWGWGARKVGWGWGGAGAWWGWLGRGGGVGVEVEWARGGGWVRLASGLWVGGVGGVGWVYGL